MEPNDIREYAQARVARALEIQQQAADEPEEEPDQSGEDNPCLQYQEECNTRNRVMALRQMLESPHGDDSPCEDPVWTAVDAVLNQALSGMEAALGLE